MLPSLCPEQISIMNHHGPLPTKLGYHLRTLLTALQGVTTNLPWRASQNLFVTHRPYMFQCVPPLENQEAGNGLKEESVAPRHSL